MSAFLLDQIVGIACILSYKEAKNNRSKYIIIICFKKCCIRFGVVSVLFNSYEFIFLFLPIILCGYFMLNRQSSEWGHYWLVLASLFFYGYWNPAYLGLIGFSICVNFCFGRYFIYGKNTKIPLCLGIIFNIALLGYYKYTDFFITNINQLFGFQYAMHNIVLPLGISFFTFTQIAYLVETYRGKVNNHHFASYVLFVTYFPHLLAGPIIHYEDVMPQFLDKRLKYVNWENMSRGMFLFSLGLFKKVIIADGLAVWADSGYMALEKMDLNMIAAWATALAYTFQLYYDFSGYTDMAIGISLMLNIKLPINFYSPYKAASIIEFWRRWHITLSSFLRDYLYIPLGGNRKGLFQKCVNIFVTMLIGGLWHGANWTFVLWGGTHGLGIVCNHLFRALNLSINKWIGILMTFLFVNFAWVLFRAPDCAQALKMYSNMLVWHGYEISLNALPAAMPDGRKEIVVEVFLFIVAVFLPNSLEIVRYMKMNRKWAVLAGAVLSVAICFLTKNTSFLYYQF